LNNVGIWRGLRRGNGKRRVRFCPRCGSVDLIFPRAIYVAVPQVECRGCGHRGIYLEGDEELAAAVRKGYLDRKAGRTQDEPEKEEE